MPFGWFGIEEIKGSIKNNTKTEEKPGLLQLNDNRVTPEKKKEPVIKQHAQLERDTAYTRPQKVYAPVWTPTTQAEIPVVLIAPSQDMALDYICSMKNNSEDIFLKNGLSFYSNDMKTTSVVIKRKMDINACFCGEEDITLPAVYTDENSVLYEFVIGISGSQEVSFKFKINSVTPQSDGLRDKIRASAAVWLLSDGNEGSDYYDTTVCNILSAEECRDIPVFILLSGFENLYHFKGSEEGAKLENNDRISLFENCRAKYSNAFSMSRGNAKIIPMQIYGGLEVKSKNSDGVWVLGLCKNTRYCSYTPVGCHMPVYYTAEIVKNTSGGFFATPAGSMIWQQFRQCFDSYLSAKHWQIQSVVKEVE